MSMICPNCGEKDEKKVLLIAPNRYNCIVCSTFFTIGADNIPRNDIQASDTIADHEKRIKELEESRQKTKTNEDDPNYV